ncbi:MAG: hypothetical protein MJ016_04365 [Victivallaceae bacterium]|nr:hypothetical protein [Victivallaceae bacterium]
MIDESVCGGLLTHSTSATFIWRRGTSGSETASVRLRGTVLSAADVLQAAAFLVGDLAGLGVGSSLYVQSLPPDKRNGFALSLIGAAGRSDIDFGVWDARFYGRADSREELLHRQGLLCGKLPLPLPVSVGGDALSGTVLIGQITPGKTKIESVGGEGAASFALQTQLRIEATAG